MRVVLVSSKLDVDASDISLHLYLFSSRHHSSVFPLLLLLIGRINFALHCPALLILLTPPLLLLSHTPWLDWLFPLLRPETSCRRALSHLRRTLNPQYQQPPAISHTHTRTHSHSLLAVPLPPPLLCHIHPAHGTPDISPAHWLKRSAA